MREDARHERLRDQDAALTYAIEDGPEGPDVGALFDLDGTLVAGFSGVAFARDRMAGGQLALQDVADIAVNGLSFYRGGLGFSGVMAALARMLRGIPEHEMFATGERLFEEQLAGSIYDEARALVEVHRKQGHTLAIASAATRYQVAHVARDGTLADPPPASARATRGREEMKQGNGLRKLAWLAAAGLVLLQAVATSTVTAAESTEAFFGELHLHTALSTDAFMNGTRKHPVTAYRFAQGDPVTLSSGQTWSLARPLDFVAITDHAESFGDLALCLDPESAVYEKPLCRGMRGSDPEVMGRTIGGWSVDGARRSPELCGEDGARCRAAEQSTWQTVQEAANRVNRPGEFTALVGFEFSPVILAPDSVTKIHRNVIFRGAKVPDRAFSSYDGTAEDLHAWLEETCRPPCRALTIPHNSNASSSQIFWEGRNSDGSPWTPEILERRARLEPLVEIYQGKGSSECHLGIGLTDEECGFEQWVRNCGPGERLGCASESDMVRDAVVRGLRVEQERGVNPHKLGFIGSTDSHLGTPGATEEADYRGQLGLPDDTPAKRIGGMSLARPGGPAPDDGGWGFGGSTKFSPGGLAAVWAPENTREAIWDALARRETFATSGTRLRVRFFGGFDLPDRAHADRDPVKLGYRKGVPMGRDLPAAPPGKVPRFVALAERDPQGAPLQKIQIVKGWVENGEEKAVVRDIACSDGLEPDASTGLCPDNGATVDLETCAISAEDADKGDNELAATWTDPDFDPELPAVYYLRVLENPVCRWSTHDAHRIGAALPKHVPATIQERAWTSPIWYGPR